jgi:hypothetical protein
MPLFVVFSVFVTDSFSEHFEDFRMVFTEYGEILVDPSDSLARRRFNLVSIVVFDFGFACENFALSIGEERAFSHETRFDAVSHTLFGKWCSPHLVLTQMGIYLNG